MKALIALFIFAATAALDARAQASAPPLSFGVIPQQAAAEVLQQWRPLLEELTRRSGYRLEVVTASDIPSFEKNVAAGAYDLIYINPYLYTVYRSDPGYEAFARQEEGLRGLVVVRRDSSIRMLADLRGRSLALTPAAFAATVLPLAQLRKERVAVIPNYVGSHDAVYRAVADGKSAAGGGVQRTLDQMPAQVRGQLRVLWSSDAYTAHAFAAHPRVPKAVVDRLRQAMIGLSTDAAGRALLQTMGFGGIVAARDADWDSVRALGIDLLEPQWRSPQPR